MKSRFMVGDWIRVLNYAPPGHIRTPFYCRGKPGTVVRDCGAFKNPEELAYGGYEAARIPLYRVAFAQTDLWADYSGSVEDKVEIELYEHWLIPSEI